MSTANQGDSSTSSSSPSSSTSSSRRTSPPAPAPVAVALWLASPVAAPLAVLLRSAEALRAIWSKARPASACPPTPGSCARVPAASIGAGAREGEPLLVFPLLPAAPLFLVVAVGLEPVRLSCCWWKEGMSGCALLLGVGLEVDSVTKTESGGAAHEGRPARRAAACGRAPTATAAGHQHARGSQDADRERHAHNRLSVSGSVRGGRSYTTGDTSSHETKEQKQGARVPHAVRRRAPTDERKVARPC